MKPTRDIKLPNINLRVYRRDKNDMTLIYNYKPIEKLKWALAPIISINKCELKYTIFCEKSSNAGDGDVKIYISYDDNNLNEYDRYKLDFSFGLDYDYSIYVEPRGVIPNLKDNLKYISQLMIWDNLKQRWVKSQSMTDNYNRHNIITHDPNNNVILKEILVELKEIKDKLK